MHLVRIMLMAGLACGPAATSAASVYHVGAPPPIVGLTAVDVVGDGRRDLVTVARSDLSIRILRGDQVLGFADPLVVPAQNDARRATAGDVNGDGIPDLLVIGHDNALDVRLGLGGGRFGPVARYGLRNHGNYVAVVDLNHDAFADVVVAHDGSGSPVFVTAFLGSSTGALQQSWELGTPYGASEGIATGDFDGDGSNDVAVAISDNRASALVLRGLGDGQFGAPVVLPTASADPSVSDGTIAIVAGDLDHDGRDDLVLACFELTNQLVVRRSTPIGFADAVTIPLPSPVAVGLGDLNGDGKPDIVACNLAHGTLTLLRGRGDGTFEAPAFMPTSPNPTAVAMTDVDDDGLADAAVTDLGDDAIRVYVNLASVSVPAGSGPSNLGFAIAGSNPIRDEAHLRFELPEAEHVRLDFFDLEGRLLPGGIDATLPAGENDVTWNCRGLAPGIYLARLAAAGQSVTVRLVRIT